MPNFSRLFNLFDKYSLEKCILLKDAIKNDFVEVIKDNHLLSKDYKDCLNIYADSLKIVIEELYTNKGKKNTIGFPDAIDFIEIHIEDDSTYTMLIP